MKKVDTDARPHTWFSERYMTERYLVSNVKIEQDYIHKLQDRVLQIFETVIHRTNIFKNF